MLRKSLTLAMVFLVSGCVTTDGPKDKDIGGKTIERSRPVGIQRKESRVQFVGESAPVVRQTTLQWRDNSYREEIVEFATKLTGRLYVEFAHPIFSERTTRHMQNPENARKLAARHCGTTPAEAKTGNNGNGDFVYAACEVGSSYRCVVALQGVGTELGPRAAPGYKAIMEFRYCSATESEGEILQRLASVRLVE